MICPHLLLLWISRSQKWGQKLASEESGAFVKNDVSQALPQIYQIRTSENRHCKQTPQLFLRHGIGLVFCVYVFPHSFSHGTVYEETDIFRLLNCVLKFIVLLELRFSHQLTILEFFFSLAFRHWPKNVIFICAEQVTLLF